MRLPIPTSTYRGNQTALSPYYQKGIAASQVAIPVTIAAKLASEHAINEVTGVAQCVGTLAGILDNYQRCVDSGSNVNCENIAARQIATIACRSYCSCR